MGELTAPTPLTEQHLTEGFDCGEEVLDDWLQKKAFKNQQNNASQTFVVCDSNQVIGYYALSTGAVDRQEALKKLSRNMPNPIPVIVLGRLAIDRSYQNKRLGAHLLRDALLRCVGVASHIGCAAVVVHALNESARQFYLKHGFELSPLDEMTLMVSMKKLIAHLS